jgi:anti-sigma B factor antagonist
MTSRADVTQVDNVTVAQLRGEIDIASGLPLVDEILRKMPDSSVGLVADLSKLNYLDSAGVRALFEVARTLTMRDQRFVISLPEDSVLRGLLKITNIEDVAAVFPNQDAAVRSIASA